MLLAFPLIWVIGAIAGLWYSQDRGIPWTTALAALPAFLLEASFYFFLGAERLRSRLEKLQKPVLAIILTVAAVVPYATASFLLDSFEWRAAGIIALFAAGASFWYVLIPEGPFADIFFLTAIAAIWILKIIPPLYVDPHPRLPLSALGQLMWFRTGLFAMVSLRKTGNVGFGFWPSGREWLIGAAYFGLFLPVAAGLARLIQFAQPHLRDESWGKVVALAIATFFGVLWVLALGEEFFFRGFLQQWMTSWLKNEWAGLAATSVLFGGVHLWYRAFPNWRFAALAAVASVFYGLAFRQAKSIRASMVTHALTVTAWRIFFA
jgi:membrane protease YdiL (CAAX protease family)